MIGVLVLIIGLLLIGAAMLHDLSAKGPVASGKRYAERDSPGDFPAPQDEIPDPEESNVPIG